MAARFLSLRRALSVYLTNQQPRVPLFQGIIFFFISKLRNCHTPDQRLSSYLLCFIRSNSCSDVQRWNLFFFVTADIKFRALEFSKLNQNLLRRIAVVVICTCLNVFGETQLVNWDENHLKIVVCLMMSVEEKIGSRGLDVLVYTSNSFA